MLREKFLGQPADLDVVTAQAGKVFDKYRGGPSLFKLPDQLHETRAVHRDTGNTVIQEMDQVGVAFLLCYFGQQLFLVADAVTLTLQIIVTRKPLIEESGRVTGFFVIRLSHKSSFPDSRTVHILYSQYNYTAALCPCQPGM